MIRDRLGATHSGIPSCARTTTEFVNFIDIAKNDRDRTIIPVASANRIMNSSIKSKDGILMSGDSKETDTKTIASNLT